MGDPDLIHIHNTWFAAGPASIRALHRAAPVLMTLHNFRIACANALLFRDGRPCLDCLGNGRVVGHPPPLLSRFGDRLGSRVH